VRSWNNKAAKFAAIIIIIIIIIIILNLFWLVSYQVAVFGKSGSQQKNKAIYSGTLLLLLLLLLSSSSSSSSLYRHNHDHQHHHTSLKVLQHLTFKYVPSLSLDMCV